MGDIVPAKITAGLTIGLVATLTAYPATAWDMTIMLRGPQAIDLEASADGVQHVISAPASETSSWAPGAYWYCVRVTDGTDVHQVEEGTVTVEADLATAEPGFDGRTHAEKVLAAIEAVLENRATISQQSYTINNRSLQRTPIGELMKLRAYYRAEVARQRNGGSRLMGRAVRVRI